MNRTLYAVLALALTASSTANALASEPSLRTSGFDVGVIRLLQPDWLFGQRTNAKALAMTMNAIEESLSAYANERPNAVSIDSCATYVAVRSQRKIKTWTQCGGKDYREIDAFIADRIKPDQIAPVKQGSLILSIHGMDSDSENLDVKLTPGEWQQAARRNSPENGSLEMEQLVNLVWPE